MWDLCFHMNYDPTIRFVALEIKTNYTRQHFSNLLYSSQPAEAPDEVFCCCIPSASRLNVFAFRDALLHILVVTRGHLSCCYLTYQLKGICPLYLASTSFFFHSELPLTGYLFSFSAHSLIVWENPSKSTVSEIDQPVRHQQPCSKSLKSPSFPILLGLNSKRSS